MAMREPSAGELDRRVLVRLRSDMPALDLGLDSLFTDQKRRWAKIEPVGTAVYANGVQTDAKITHRVTFYFLKGMSESHEVVHGATIYRVRRVADMNGNRRFTLLEVEELGPEQAGGGIYG
ncbi:MULTISPECIES: head-tail adaptor protein [Pseudomonas]|uniref:head-tail adaptor protein n=1 Tax=Pseudomonas TaxID=286 RepID=UPI00103C141D|nr:MULTISPECIES: head-tail adaptor protein [Pseudomonas]MDR6581603.1 head-tail adaptor [Pseudomonas extremaustralis]WLD68665.1 head-tail adaptor protein [Pseudomonas sp. OVF7]WLI52880.1 head-tail adaptor protein [Pseudomonas sp. FP833]